MTLAALGTFSSAVAVVAAAEVDRPLLVAAATGGTLVFGALLTAHVVTFLVREWAADWFDRLRATLQGRRGAPRQEQPLLPTPAKPCVGSCRLTVRVTYDYDELPRAGDRQKRFLEPQIAISRIKWEVSMASAHKCHAAIRDARVMYYANRREPMGVSCLLVFPKEKPPPVRREWADEARECGATLGGTEDPSLPPSSVENVGDLGPIEIRGEYSWSCAPVGDCETVDHDDGLCDGPPIRRRLRFEFNYDNNEVDHDGKESRPDPTENTVVVTWEGRLNCSGECIKP